VVNSKRTIKNTRKLVHLTVQRLPNKVPRLITSDEYKPYETAILETFGEKKEVKRAGKCG